ncbi:NAD(P)-dependent oxidoreductase [Natronococcus jeotgali]|uniref:NmrA family protein n=1 Tax=Natronococcus jeotgali DSM 18795 TaxID=1227498 RepID=L9XCG0_9EURY|nr:NAD(P)H-binding protein [Natronococcus jeotgali]ELY59327.1 NmrA family protein [Natronococcus jeotgali DSM 18795]
MKIAVFGATGRTGRPVCEQALERGHEIVVHARSPDRVQFTDDRVTVVEGDAYTGDGVRDAVESVDAVVSVLGQGDGSPDDLLTVAGEQITDAMTERGVLRFVTLVGAGVREDGESVSLGGKMMGVLLKLLARDVLEDAETHVESVRETDLEWTVVRVPRLSEGDRTGAYRAGEINLGFDAIDRADVARFILDCLEDDRNVREMPKVGPA